MRRRYQRVVKEEGKLPDLLLIDGGKGQMQRCFQVIQSLQLDNRVLVMGIGKGPSRRPGLEVLYLPDGRELVPGGASAALHLLQQVRDEAHRFAITGHRARRGKARRSGLEDIPGWGPSGARHCSTTSAGSNSCATPQGRNWPGWRASMRKPRKPCTTGFMSSVPECVLERVPE